MMEDNLSFANSNNFSRAASRLEERLELSRIVTMSIKETVWWNTITLIWGEVKKSNVFADHGKFPSNLMKTTTTKMKIDIPIFCKKPRSCFNAFTLITKLSLCFSFVYILF